MSELKRTQLYEVHVQAGASMVDFGGWEMPIQYPSGIVAEHLYTRHACSLFDVSHMGRLLIEGPDRLAFLQHVLTSNVAGLEWNTAQYCIIPASDGSAVDDAYLYRFEEDRYLLVVNAANTAKDLAHLEQARRNYNCTITNITSDYAAIAVQGPKSKELLQVLSGGAALTEPMRNALNTLTLEGRPVRIAKTGYTGEPLGYEVYIRSQDAPWLWNRLVELGAKPAGLGARDTLRLEAALPLYGHEMGVDPDGVPMPIFAVPLAKFAVSFAPQKGDYIGREALERQYGAFRRIMNREFQDMADLPRRIQPITLLDRGVMRSGMPVYRNGRQIGWVTSGTMVPYYRAEGEGLETVILDETAKRAIGLCYIDSDVLEDDRVEQLLVEQMRQYLGCAEVETRTISGQMSNMATFSALMDWKNRLDRKHDPRRLGYILNNHIIKGGHLSAQPMGALHDYVAIDPVTERHAIVNFPVCKDNIYKIDVEETKKVIAQYRPELIIFGKSMVLHTEPVAEIRRFVDEEKIPTTIMYDMAHVLGLVGDYFQKPFEEGAEIVTGSTHKTFFGPQRGVIGVNYKKEDLKYGLWETIEARAFPGSVSNHHLGTQLGLLMAAYEMNQFKDSYQKAIVENAKHFAKCLKAQGLDVAGDPAVDYTQTHQVIVSVGYGVGPQVARRLEQNHIIVNYQATPDEEGFTASGALRMGVSEMTRFGFGKEEFSQLAELIADCILRSRDVSGDVERLRAAHTQMQYCFQDQQFQNALEDFAGQIGL